MDFFEEVGRRLTEIGQGLMMYVNNFSAVNQINSTISANEKQIAQLITELGQAYYENNKDNASDPLYEKVAAITALQAEIEVNRNNYQQLQANGPKAPAAEAPVAPVASEAPAAPENSICTNCGSTIPAGSTFCTNCGSKIG